MAEQKRERRKSERYRLRDAWVEFTDSGLLSLFKRSAGRRVPIEDLSLFGLRMATSAELKTGRAIGIKITVPFMAESADTHGVIVWCRRAPRSRHFQVGIRFDDRSREFRGWLEEFEDKAGDIPVNAECPFCQHAFKVKRWLVGKSAACPACKQAIRPLEELIDEIGEGLRSAESVLEAMDDMAGADVGTVKGSVLHPRIQHFLMKYIASPLHLALVEYIADREGSRIDVREAARTLDCRERDLVGVCEDFSALDILKKVNNVFIYNPDMVAKRDVHDFMRDYGDPETKAKVLAFVLAAGEDEEGLT